MESHRCMFVAVCTHVHVCRPDGNLRCRSLDAVWDRPTLEVSPGPLLQKPLPSLMGSCGDRRPVTLFPLPGAGWPPTACMDRRHLKGLFSPG